MHILIIASQNIPSLAKQLNQEAVVFGGWVEGAILGLHEHTDLKLSFVYPSKSFDVQSYVWLGIQTIGLPQASDIGNSLDHLNPDIVHVFGTESRFVQLCISRFDHVPSVISIQGVMFENARAFFKSLGNDEGFGSLWYILVSSLKNMNALSFYKRARAEEKQFKKIKHVIGRTSMDKSMAERYGLNYHFNNETLRPLFYETSLWHIDTCNKYQIYVSQGSYPLKGIHILIRALANLIHEFPELQCRIGGEDLRKNQAITHKWGISYSNFVIRLIEHYGLQDHVHYIGFQSEEQVVGELLKAHCFVMPSLMENSPNALGEAMILGVPCIASNVGGIPSMVGEDVLLYPDRDASVLSEQIKRVFTDTQLCLELSMKGRKRALINHDIETNALTLRDIYLEISDRKHSHEDTTN